MNKKKYVLVCIYLIDGDRDWLFDTRSSNMNNDNVHIMKIMDLTDEEAMVMNNKIALYENIKWVDDGEVFLRVYRLIPEDSFFGFVPKRLDIPEDTVIQCDIPNMVTLLKNKKLSYKEFITVIPVNMKYTKRWINNRTEVSNYDFARMEALEFNGFYYHLETIDHMISRHTMFFFKENLNEVLTKIPYNEFEDRMKEKAYKIIQDYLKEHCNGDIDKMDEDTIKYFF